MRKQLLFALLELVLGIVGLAMIWHGAGGLVAAGVFLMIFGNNIAQASRRRR